MGLDIATIQKKAGRDLTDAEKKVIDVIATGNALVAIVLDRDWDISSNPPVDYQQIDQHYLEQMIDPTTHRPSRSADFFAKEGAPLPNTIKKVVDLNLDHLTIQDHHPGQSRYQKPAGYTYTHTTKTSTSLIPSDPQYMELWRSDVGLGFLWDINACDLRNEKYVFSRNAATDHCFWLDVDNEEKVADLKDRLTHNPLTSIAALQEINNKAIQENKPVFWNEILAGLPRNRIDALFTPQDKSYFRLRAWDLMQHTKEKLGLAELPIFIMQSQYAKEEKDDVDLSREGVFRVYTENEHEEDALNDVFEKDAQLDRKGTIEFHNGFAMTLMPNQITEFLDQISASATEVSGSLIPPKIEYMQFDDQQPLGLIWDIKRLNLDQSEKNKLDLLRAKNNQAIETKTIIPANHLVATVSPENMNNDVAIFSIKNDIDSRLAAWNLMLAIKSKFNLTFNLPVFIASPDLELYTEEARDQDQNIKDLHDLNSNLNLNKNQKNYSSTRFFAQATKDTTGDYVIINHTDIESSVANTANSCSLM